MRVLTAITALAASATALSVPRDDDDRRGGPKGDKTNTNKLIPANYDGECFYPIPDPSFKLDTYLGKWYQVAGYSFRETAGGECITAQYSLNPNGTVRVNNGGRAGETTIGAIGTATPVGKEYGKGGAFVVEFPQGFPSGCPGPNYIVQEYKKGDYSIVQTQNWDTLFILSREQFPSEEKLAKLIDRAVKLGSNATEIIPFSQEGCPA